MLEAEAAQLEKLRLRFELLPIIAGNALGPFLPIGVEIAVVIPRPKLDLFLLRYAQPHKLLTAGYEQTWATVRRRVDGFALLFRFVGTLVHKGSLR